MNVQPTLFLDLIEHHQLEGVVNRMVASKLRRENTEHLWKKIEPILEAHGPRGIVAAAIATRIGDRALDPTPREVAHVARKHGARGIGSRPARWVLPPEVHQ